MICPGPSNLGNKPYNYREYDPKIEAFKAAILVFTLMSYCIGMALLCCFFPFFMKTILFVSGFLVGGLIVTYLFLRDK